MTSPQIHAQPVDYLLREVARLQAENRRLRSKISYYKQARNEWKLRAEGAVKRPAKAIPPDDPRHGTENGYGNLRCRCGKCRAAHAVYTTAANHRTGRTTPYDDWLASVEGCHVPHGTESRYTHGGCRCDECRRAQAEARNSRRRATPEKIERQRAYDRERKRRARRSLA